MAFWKKLNNADTVPVLKDELVLDTTPTVNSTNAVTSDGVARAIAGASGEVPVVTENDNGKVLTAVYDEGGAAVEWSAAPNEVPAVGENDNAKVLTATYSEGTGSFAWSAAPSELPDTTGASQGDVLSIGSSGLEWATPAAGDEVPTVTSSDNGKVLTATYSGGVGSYAWASAGGGGGTYTRVDTVLFGSGAVNLTWDPVGAWAGTVSLPYGQRYEEGLYQIAINFNGVPAGQDYSALAGQLYEVTSVKYQVSTNYGFADDLARPIGAVTYWSWDGGNWCSFQLSFLVNAKNADDTNPPMLFLEIKPVGGNSTAFPHAWSSATAEIRKLVPKASS